jgi:hypothetical protein
VVAVGLVGGCRRPMGHTLGSIARVSRRQVHIPGSLRDGQVTAQLLNPFHGGPAHGCPAETCTEQRMPDDILDLDFLQGRFEPPVPVGILPRPWKYDVTRADVLSINNLLLLKGGDGGQSSPGSVNYVAVVPFSPART